MLWRKIRWPLFVLLVVALLTTVGTVTHNLLVSRNIEHTVAQARGAEAVGSVEQLEVATRLLRSLAERHSDRANAQEAWAWQAALNAAFFGPRNAMLTSAQEALAEVEPDLSHIGLAARALVLHFRGQSSEGLEMARMALNSNPEEPRLALATALCLHGVGKSDEALKSLDAAISITPEYVPFIIAMVEIAAESEHADLSDRWTKRLLFVSPKHVYGLLMELLLAMPKWGQRAIDAERAAELDQAIKQLKATYEKAPPALVSLGRYLEGRISLLNGRGEAALKALRSVAETSENPLHYAWYVAAVRETKGPAAALALLEKKGSAIERELIDLRAQCLLDFHKSKAAKEAIDLLEKTMAPASRIKALRFAWAVRSGDLASAMSFLPASVEPESEVLALELFYQQMERGDRQGIEKLTKVFSPALKPCAEAIQLWTSRRTEAAIIRLSAQATWRGTCEALLAAHLMPGHMVPSRLFAAAERAKKGASHELMVELDGARAAWRSAGRDEALKRLDALVKLGPEGPPLRRAMARAFLDMELPERARALLAGLESDPESLAVALLAAEAAKADNAKLLTQAQKLNAQNPHAGLSYFLNKQRLNEEKAQEVIAAIDRAKVFELGGWAAKNADLLAKALTVQGDKAEADRVLFQAAKQAAPYGGIEESLDIALNQVEMNLRRGGKFLYRAMFLLDELRQQGVRDPRVSYHFAMANIKQGNEGVGLKLLKDAIELDPTYKPAYEQLSAINRLDEASAAMLAKMWPQAAANTASR